MSFALNLNLVLERETRNAICAICGDEIRVDYIGSGRSGFSWSHLARLHKNNLYFCFKNQFRHVERWHLPGFRPRLEEFKRGAILLNEVLNADILATVELYKVPCPIGCEHIFVVSTATPFSALTLAITQHFRHNCVRLHEARLILFENRRIRGRL